MTEGVEGVGGGGVHGGEWEAEAVRSPRQAGVGGFLSF